MFDDSISLTLKTDDRVIKTFVQIMLLAVMYNIQRIEYNPVHLDLCIKVFSLVIIACKYLELPAIVFFR